MKRKHIDAMREVRLWGEFVLKAANTVNAIRATNRLCGIVGTGVDGMINKKIDNIKRVREEKEKVYENLGINAIDKTIFESKREKVLSDAEKAQFKSISAEVWADLERLDKRVDDLSKRV